MAVETKLVASDGADGHQFGAGLAIQGDVMVVAAPWANVGGIETSGAVYVYLRDAARGAWVEHQHLLPADGNFGDSFLELQLAIDGETIVVGTPFETLRSFQEGAVYVFERAADGFWAETARLADVSVDFGGHFGSGVDLEGDLLAIGAAQDSSARNGLVYLFERDEAADQGWRQATTIRHSAVDDGVYPKSFGISVDLDGDLLVIGASRTSLEYGTADGAAYLFRRNAETTDHWDFLARLVRPGADDCVGGRPLFQLNLEATPEAREAAAECARANPVKSGSFGHRVALAADRLVATARFAAGEDGTYSVGEAHVYERTEDADAWQHAGKLAAGSPSAFAYFGSALALGDNAVLIGAPSAMVDQREDQGAAHLFVPSAEADGGWIEAASFVAADGVSRGWFGRAVAFDGDGLAFGANGDGNFRGAVYLHARAAEPDEPDDGGPTFPPTGELLDETPLIHASGVILGAVEGASLDPLPVWVHEVGAPAEALLPGAVPVGAYYNVGASTAAWMPADETFALALPVPAGTNVQALAVAALVPAESVLDGATETGQVWTLVPGAHDDENDLYVVTPGVLVPEGMTVVLVEHPDMVPAATDPTALRTMASGSSGHFAVDCYSSNCAATVPAMLNALEHAHAVYDRFFDEPFLTKKAYAYCAADSVFCGHVGGSELYRGINVWQEPVQGHSPQCDYAPAATGGFWRTMNICFDVTNRPQDYFDATVAHELFHAYQMGIEAVARSNRFNWELWMFEGMATAAAGSVSSLVVPPGDRLQRDWTSSQNAVSDLDHKKIRRIDHSLNVPKQQGVLDYEAQDFWVHFGQVQQLPLDYTKLLLSEGMTASGLDAQLAWLFQAPVADTYWRWVKNQAMLEDGIDFFPDGPGGPNLPPLDQPPCVLQPKVVAHDPDTMELMLQHRLTMTLPGTFSQVLAVPLLPLQADVVEIEFPTGTPGLVLIRANGPGLRHKVYLDQPEDLTDAACRNVPDGDRTVTAPLPPGAKAYVLVANTLHTGTTPTTYEVRVDVPD